MKLLIICLAVAISMTSGVPYSELSQADKNVVDQTEAEASAFYKQVNQQADLMTDPNERQALKNYIKRTEDQLKSIKDSTDFIPGSIGFYGNVRNAFGTAVSSWGDLTSGDPQQVFTGMMSLGNSLSNFVPDPLGAAIGSACTIFSALLGKTAPSMSDIIAAKIDESFKKLYKYLDGKFEEIKDHIDGVQVQSLRAEYEGAKFTVQNMAAVMQGLKLSGTPLLEGDITFLHTQVSSTSGLRVMGMLNVMIRHMITTVAATSFHFELNKGSATIEDVEELYEMMKLYAELSTFRKLLLTEARSIYENSDITAASESALKQVLQVNVNYDKALFEFMVKPKNNFEWFVVSRFNPKDTFLSNYLTSIDRHPLTPAIHEFFDDSDPLQEEQTVCVKIEEASRSGIVSVVYRPSHKAMLELATKPDATESNTFNLKLRMLNGLPQIHLETLRPGLSNVPFCSKGTILFGDSNLAASCQFMIIKHQNPAGEGLEGRVPYSWVLFKQEEGNDDLWQYAQYEPDQGYTRVQSDFWKRDGYNRQLYITPC